ncbi:MAG: hypothetical protein ACI3XH_05950 [Phascolarctobacterium sp.]
MKKLVFLLVALFVTMMSCVAWAAEKPTVAVMYVNHAETKYDAEIDSYMLGELQKMVPATNYNYVDGAGLVYKLNQIGITDISTAERADIIDALEGEKVDYVLYCEIQPFVRKEKVHMFNYGIEMTTQVPIKIIDVKNNKYLYNGKIVAKGADSAVVGGLGNKGSAMKALHKVTDEMRGIVIARLPRQ